MWQVLWLVLGLMFTSVCAAEVALTMRAEKESRVVINGDTLIKMVPVRRISVGDVITITLAYHNQGPDTAYNIRIDNPLPAGTRFVTGSGFGANAQFQVSYDQGQTFDADVHVRPEPVTHVRWVFDELPGDAQGEVGFQLKVEKAGAHL